jgi:hypothetical protein
VADSSGGEVANLDEAAAETRDETELSVEEHWLAGDEDEL